MPPNIRTAALEATSGTASRPAAETRSEDVLRSATVASTAARSCAYAAAPAGAASCPAVMSETDRTMASYQESTVSASVPASPSASVTTATASGPAKARRRSTAPVGSRAVSSRAVMSRSVSRSMNEAKPSRTSRGRKGWLKGSRWRACSAPSSDSMLGPTTCAVENRGSSTVKVAASRITLSARSRRVTSHPSSSGSHGTGSRARSCASRGCGSRASSASVVAAPSGKESTTLIADSGRVQRNRS